MQNINGDDFITKAKEIDDHPGDYWNGENSELDSVYDKAKAAIPRLIVPRFGDNSRIINQRGVFSIWNSPVSMNFLSEQLKINSNWDENEPYLLKVKIRDEDRNQILEYLYEFNLNYLNLYPDIEGTCKYQNWKFGRYL